MPICKNCKKEIPPNSNSCPHCRASTYLSDRSLDPSRERRTNAAKARKGTIEGFMEIDVIDDTTGKPMHFDIDLGKVALPHQDKNLEIEPNYYRVVFANKAINSDKSIGGMNYFAASAYDKFPYPTNVVQIAQQTTFHKGDRYKNRREKLRGTIAHEVIEAELMRTDKKLPYHIAHMYAMEYEKGIYHHSDKIRVKDSSSKESSIHTVFRMYEKKAVVENTDKLNVTSYAGAVKNSRGWVLSTGYIKRSQGT